MGGEVSVTNLLLKVVVVAHPLANLSKHSLPREFLLLRVAHRLKVEAERGGGGGGHEETEEEGNVEGSRT